MINEVRNTVLSVLNKNNFGYISPSDFNLYAENAQMEIYEEYFANYNKSINLENTRVAGSDYAEVEGPIAEALETFLVTNYLSHIGANIFSAPSLVTTNDTSYYILKMLCYPHVLQTGTNTSILIDSLDDSNATFITNGVKIGDIAVNTTTNDVATVISVISETQLLLDADIFTSSGDDYVIISQKIKEAEKVSVGKITMLNSSLLTAPNNIFPSYTLEGDKIKIFPNTMTYYGQLQAVYFRHPKPPKWTYVSIFNGEPSFNQSAVDYQDFELPPEDIYKLVTVILRYCGISIRETEVAQYAMAQEQQQQ
jgi:hypothetical protein